MLVASSRVNPKLRLRMVDYLTLEHSITIKKTHMLDNITNAHQLTRILCSKQANAGECNRLNRLNVVFCFYSLRETLQLS